MRLEKNSQIWSANYILKKLNKYTHTHTYTHTYIVW